MALIFHSGFETGDFSEWVLIFGSPAVVETQKKTGIYAMQCDTTGGAATAYVVKSTPDDRRLTVYIYISTAPNVEAIILGSVGMSYCNIRLTDDRHLTLYIDTTLKDTGSNQLALNTWYRISLSVTGDEAYGYLNGTLEVSTVDVAANLVSARCGILTEVTADIYFDDFAVDDDYSGNDIGDIRVARASPNAAGEYTNFDTLSGYTNCDEVPASDADYVHHAASSQAHEIYNLQSCSDIGIGGSDTINAVSSWFRMKRGGGGPTYHAHMVRDDGTDYPSADLDNGVVYTWWNRYDAVMPNGKAAWTQVRVDAFQAGFSHYNGGGQDTYGSCVMVMVAYTPAVAPPPVYIPRHSGTVGVLII